MTSARSLWVAGIAAGAVTLGAQAPLELRLGQVETWRAGAGESRGFQVRAAPGDLVRVEVESAAGDLVVEVTDGAAPSPRVFDRWGAGRRLPETASWIAAAGAPVTTITVRLDGADVRQPVDVRVRLVANAPPSTDERAVLDLEALEQEASAARRTSTASSRERAVAAYTQAAEAWRARGEWIRAGRALMDAGGVLSALGRPKDARPIFEQALEALRERAPATEVADALNRLAITARLTGDTARARTLYGEALARFRAAGHRQGEASVLHNLGTAWTIEADFVSAKRSYEDALAIRRTLGDDGDTGETLIALGVALRNSGDAQGALQAYTEAISRKRAAADREGEARALANLGTAYSALGDPARAIEIFAQSLAITRATGDVAWQATALSGSGRAAILLGDLGAAAKYFADQLPLARRGGDRPNYLRALVDLARLHIARGAPAEAAPLLDEAGIIADEIGHRLLAEEVVRRRAAVALERGDLDAAEVQARQAAALSEALGTQGARAESVGMLAEIARRRGQLELALAESRRAIQLHEQVRRAVDDPERQAGLRDSADRFYKREVGVLLALDAATPGAGHADAALVASERGRSDVLRRMLIETRAGLRAGVPADLVARDAALRQALDDKERQRTRLLGTRFMPEARAAIEREITALDNEYAGLQGEIRRLDPRYAALTSPGLETVADLRAALPPDSVAVHYSLDDAASAAWIVTADRVTAVRLAPGPAIDAAGRRLLEVLQQGPRRELEARVARAAADLAALVVDPIVPLLGHAKVVIVADGVLHLVPMAMLPDPSNRGEPLLERFEIAMAPSLGTLGVLRQAGASRAPRGALVVADPVYSADDDRARGGGPPAAEVPAGNRRAVPDDLRRSANESGLTALDRLPHTALEAQAVARAGRTAATVDVASGLEATRELLLGATPSQYRIVHIAAHGIVNPSRPSASGLVLSLVGPDGATADGFLRLRDVNAMQLDAELVVLSACRTAAGRRADGEGLLGLSRAFMYAGARTVVASLWDVRDASTARLMSAFYAELLGRGATSAGALREAQRRLRRDPLYRSPFHWAGFVAQGDAHRAVAARP